MKTNKDGTIFSIAKCEKCDNPITMYWCNECENSEDEPTCHLCGKEIINIDLEYHNNCN